MSSNGVNSQSPQARQGASSRRLLRLLIILAVAIVLSLLFLFIFNSGAAVSR